MNPIRQLRTDDIPVMARQIVDALPLAAGRLDDGLLYDRVQVILLAYSRPAMSTTPCAVCNRTAAEMLSEGHCLPCELEKLVWKVHAENPNNVAIQKMIDQIFERAKA